MAPALNKALILKGLHGDQIGDFGSSCSPLDHEFCFLDNIHALDQICQTLSCWAQAPGGSLAIHEQMGLTAKSQGVKCSQPLVLRRVLVICSQ